MGSFDGECEMCNEKKSIRIECNCGNCICEDCRDDWWIDNEDMCYYCFESKTKDLKIENLPEIMHKTPDFHVIL